MDTGATPVGRGETHYGVDGTIPATYGQTVGMEGRPHVFPDTNPANRLIRRSQNDVHTLLVRNVSGFTIYACQVMLWAAGYRGKRVAGLVNTAAVEVAGVVDDHIGVNGVRNGDLFHLVVKGPQLVLLSMTAAEANGIAEGDHLVGVTAATSGATTAGRFKEADLTGATDVLAANILNRIGRAISACTTAHTGQQRLVDVNIAA